MCIRDRAEVALRFYLTEVHELGSEFSMSGTLAPVSPEMAAVSYTHLRAHETVLDLVCRLLLEKKKHTTVTTLSVTVKQKHIHYQRASRYLTAVHTSNNTNSRAAT